jgi:hypothetical protein
MKSRLTEILNTVNGFYLYDDNMARQYISLIEESIDVIRNIEATPTSLLDNAKDDAIYELSNELASRMNESFFHANFERKKSEFKISKMLIVVSIGNVLSNMPDE